MNKTLIALGTAAAIGLGALVPSGQAMAAPLSPAMAGAVEVGSGLEQVGHRKRHFKRGIHVYVGKPYYGHYYGPKCRYKKVKVWSPYHHGYVWKTRKVCRGW